MESPNNQNDVDITPEMVYNSSEHDVNEVHIIKMDEQKPINDTTCRHETLIPDPDDTIGEAIYHGCANRKCGVGFYIRPDMKK